MYLLHVSIFYICLLYQLSLFSSSSSSSSPPPPLPPPSISFPPGCRSLFLRAKFTFRYRARARSARLARTPMCESNRRCFQHGEGAKFLWHLYIREDKGGECGESAVLGGWLLNTWAWVDTTKHRAHAQVSGSHGFPRFKWVRTFTREQESIWCLVSFGEMDKREGVPRHITMWS